MKTIAVITTSRADYGIYLPVLRKIVAAPDLKLCLIAGGSHLAAEYGASAGMIRADGFQIAETVECLPAGDSAVAVSSAMGRAVAGFAEAYSKCAPDMVLVLGDRFEMFAAAAAAVPLLIPIAHIHGGEVTEGAIDDSFRHAITKMSHLHFVATADSRRRVLQMGEEPWRVTLAGAPSLDNLAETELLDGRQAGRALGVVLENGFLLATYHPVTREYRDTRRHVEAWLRAIERSGLPVLFTAPNSDTSRGAVAAALEKYVRCHAGSHLVANLGTRLYFSLMKTATAMVGNSSSGIIEAASFGLPVVNVGNRQRGRLHGRNVIDVPCEAAAILRGIRLASRPGFRASLQRMRNPYGDGKASARICAVLRETRTDARLINKRFSDA